MLPIPSPDLEFALQETLDRHLSGNDGRTPPHLAESIRYSLLAPGKRIRPRLAIACGDMIGLPRKAALAAALCIEMIHCFTLIHDDLPCMDDDDFRRGRPSNHKQFGESTALLAGDGLIAVAVDTLLDASDYVAAANVVQAMRRLAWAMGPRGVIGGQAAESLLGPDSKLEDLQAMHAGKTGALFAASLLLPKDLANLEASVGADSLKSRSIDTFAAELGLGFQVLDDLDDAAKEARSPRNVLFYLSEAEARDRFTASLRRAMKHLSAAWGERAGPLLAIADEVATRLAPGGGT